MAVNYVCVYVNGIAHTLSYNSSTQKYEKTITAPSITSYNVNAGHYYPITVEVEDEAGNLTTVNDLHATLGASLKLKVLEKTKPTITITTPGAGAFITNNKPSISFQLRDETNGSGVDKTTLALKINGGSAITWNSTGMSVTANGNGFDCTYVVQSALPEGNNTVQIDIKDFDGNIANTVSRTFTVDTLPPVLNVTSPVNGGITNSNSITVNGSTNDVTSSPVTVNITLNGVDQGVITVEANGSFSKALTLSEGLNTIVIRSTDGVGKYSEVTRTMTLDITPPVITLIELVPNPVDSGATLIIKVTCSDA